MAKAKKRNKPVHRREIGITSSLLPEPTVSPVILGIRDHTRRIQEQIREVPRGERQQNDLRLAPAEPKPDPDVTKAMEAIRKRMAELV